MAEIENALAGLQMRPRWHHVRRWGALVNITTHHPDGSRERFTTNEAGLRAWRYPGLYTSQLVTEPDRTTWPPADVGDPGDLPDLNV